MLEELLSVRGLVTEESAAEVVEEDVKDNDGEVELL